MSTPVSKKLGYITAGPVATMVYQGLPGRHAPCQGCGKQVTTLSAKADSFKQQAGALTTASCRTHTASRYVSLHRPSPGPGPQRGLTLMDADVLPGGRYENAHEFPTRTAEHLVFKVLMTKFVKQGDLSFFQGGRIPLSAKADSPLRFGTSEAILWAKESALPGTE